jgi:hypothetical protein
MPFLSTGAFTTFNPNTKAKSAEVNANFAAVAAFLQTTTSDLLIGSLWQGVVSTSASHTITASDAIGVFVSAFTTSTGATVFLPSAAACAGRLITVIHNGTTAGSVTIDPAGAESFDTTTSFTLDARYDSATFISNGVSKWHSVARNNAATTSRNGLITAGDQTLAGVKTFSGQLIGKGTATNDSAATGYIGEYASAVLVRSLATGLVSATPKTVISKTFDPGDWNVTGAIGFTPGATTAVTQVIMAFSLNTNTLPAASDTYAAENSGETKIQAMYNSFTIGSDIVFPMPTVRLLIAATTTLYLVARGSFTSTLDAYGEIRARRMR